jgi:D-alanyl-lipoteichoic acid acyltransferase DltB (MBOAT superfamily)
LAALEQALNGGARAANELRRNVVRAALAVPCVLVIVLAAANDYLFLLPGFGWVPHVQLRMQFNSYVFLLLFVPCMLALYALYRESRLANWILASGSLVVYATVGLIYLVPLLFTCIFDYLAGAYMARASDARKRKVVFVSSLVVQLSLLAVFKYAGWLSGEVNALSAYLGLGFTVAQLSLPLPPGISFYTFHTISYTADIYQHKFVPRVRLADYVTFVSFFPQLVAGPIARASELLPQVAAKRPMITAEAAEGAVWLIAWGLFKKMCLADNFGLLVSQATAALGTPNGAPGVGYIFMYAFAAQIYCDFSAYTDIARGIARLFGIELTRNFLTPYFSRSPSEFWQRWHISLSRWLRDYLYIPLGGERHGRWNTLRNLAITMFLGGLWHGAGIGFIVWGLYHGALLVLYRVLPVDQILEKYLKGLGSVLAVLLMFNLVCIGWIFFRAPHEAIGPLLASLASLPSSAAQGSLLWGMVLFGAPLLVTETIARWNGVEFVDVGERMRWWLRAPVYVAIFYAIVFFAAREQNEFIYFRF